MNKRFSHAVSAEAVSGTGNNLRLEIRQTRIEGELFLSRRDLMRLMAEMAEAKVSAGDMARVLAQLFLEADPQRPTN